MDLLYRLTCEYETKSVKPPTTKLLEGLDQYFGDGGPLQDCSYEQLCVFAETIYNKYMCNAAYEDSLGANERTPSIYQDEPEDIPHLGRCNNLGTASIIID